MFEPGANAVLESQGVSDLTFLCMDGFKILAVSSLRSTHLSQAVCIDGTQNMSDEVAKHESRLVVLSLSKKAPASWLGPSCSKAGCLNALGKLLCSE